MAREGLVKIHVEMPDDSGFSGETLWARPLGDGLYEVASVPFFAGDVHRGDVVRCADDGDGLPLVAGVVEYGGHESLRVSFAAGAGDEAIGAALDEVTRLGAYVERASRGLALVDVPPEA